MLLEVGGVGYVVTVTPRTLAELEPSSPAFLYVHHHIREDAQTLYGFLHREERTTFEILDRDPRHRAGARRRDPRHAQPGALVDIVATNDLGALTLVPGVGKKTAERLLVELRNRLSMPVLDPVGVGGGNGSSTVVGDVREALAGLGYAPEEIRDVAARAAGQLGGAGAAARRAEAARGQACVRSSSTRATRPEPDRRVEQFDDVGLRPRSLAEFVGQRELKEHLAIVLEAAKRRGQPADHLLLAGPPGLGKTSMAGIVAVEMGVHLHITSGPALERAGDLAAILTKLEEGDVLFIDEIHRLSRAVEEILYPAMEDFQLDIVVGKGPAASSIRLTIPPFTLVGATTRTGMITGPLRDRFGLVARLDYYSDEELETIVTRTPSILRVSIDPEGAWEIARRSRGTPRIANRLLRRVRDFSEVRGDGRISATTAQAGLALFGVDARGLDKVDRAILHAVCNQFGGGPVGLSTVAISVGEQPETVEDMYEPFLIQQGMLARTPRGRIAMPAAWLHLGQDPPTPADRPPGLFD